MSSFVARFFALSLKYETKKMAIPQSKATEIKMINDLVSSDTPSSSAFLRFYKALANSFF
jgi:hypothetical protein